MKRKIPQPHNTADVKAFEILVRQYHRRLLAYATTLTRQEAGAEDLVQDAFVTAYQNLAKFDTSRDFGAWVRGIIKNKYYEWMRSRRESLLDEHILDAIDRQHQRWDRAIEKGSLNPLRALQYCITKLSAVLRQAVDLFYLKRQPCAAIATHLETSEASIKKRLQRARENLAKCVNHRLKISQDQGEE